MSRSTSPAPPPRPTRERPRGRDVERTTAQLIADGNLALKELPLTAVSDLFASADTLLNKRDRRGEEDLGVSQWHQIRAILASDDFWEIARELPFNDLTKQRTGRPRHYPSWVLFLGYCLAGISSFSTMQSVVTFFEDADSWTMLAHHADQYAPDGFTRIRDIPAPKTPRERRPKARAMTHRTGQVRARKPRHGTVRHLLPRCDVLAPRGHHFDHIGELLRGFDKSGARLMPGHPWYGVRKRIIAHTNKRAMAQAQAMGLLDPTQPFQFQHPDPKQYIGFDGVVFPMPKPKAAPPTDWPFATHEIAGGERKQYGSKFTIASTRIFGQYGSRIYLDFGHTSNATCSEYRDESAAALAMAPDLRDRSNGGMKGILWDSAVRGLALVALQYEERLVVVNFPHAESNPDRQSKGRLNKNRVEKSHLRTVAEHKDSEGKPCRHLIYAVGGALAELAEHSDGTWSLVPLTELDYECRENAPRQVGQCARRGCTKPECTEPRHRIKRTRREYKKVRIACATNSDFTIRVALFHSDPVATGGGSDPTYNWGEVLRVFSPSTPAFKLLNGGRNDTESRHADLKRRMRYLPRSVEGQELRLLGAMIASNAQSWHIHLQAHGEPNVLDETG